MASIVCYIAVSLDGFVSGPGGAMDWLNDYGDALAGYGAFDASIACSVMGRETFEFVRKFAPPNSTDTRRSVVLTHRTLEGAPAHVEAYSGDIGALAKDLRTTAAARGGDVWLVGGGKAIRSFADAGEIDRWRLFVVPVMLGDGARLLAEGREMMRKYRLTGTNAFASGVVELAYEQ